MSKKAVFANMAIIWPLTSTFGLGQSSTSSPTYFVPSMTNDGILESSYEGEFVLGFLVGDRHNLKDNNLVQGKQTAGLTL